MSENPEKGAKRRLSVERPGRVGVGQRASFQWVIWVLGPRNPDRVEGMVQTECV